jgi:hypothetical protein
MFTHWFTRVSYAQESVENGRSGRLVGHMDGRPAIHHLQTDSIKSVEAPLYPYIRILTAEFTYTTLFL